MNNEKENEILQTEGEPPVLSESETDALLELVSRYEEKPRERRRAETAPDGTGSAPVRPRYAFARAAKPASVRAEADPTRKETGPAGETEGPAGEARAAGRKRAAAQKMRVFHLGKIALTFAAVALMALLAVVLPRPKQSVTEKRMLAKFPSFSFASFFSGDYFEDIGKWFSDTVPNRDALTAMNAKLQHLLGAAGAQAGFNEGVKGDEIPDAQPVDTPQDETAPVSAAELPTETEQKGTSAPPVTEVPAFTVPEDPNKQTAPAAPVFEQLGGVLISGNAGFEYYNFVRSTADKYIAAVDRAASVLAGKAQVYAMVIPTSMDITLDSRVRTKITSTDDQKKACAYFEGQLSKSVKTVPIFAALFSHREEYIYFRTDHHWTQLGAYYAYVEFCRAKGVQPVSLGACERRDFEGFLGSFYNDSGQDPALGNAPDVVQTFTPPGNSKLTVYNNGGGEIYSGNVIFDETNAPASNKYGAFIFGDNSLTVLENDGAASEESCLLVKESFGNAFAPLLIANYKTVYVMDYRYCTSTVAQLVAQYGINDVIFANNLSMTRSASLVDQMAAKIG